MFSAMVNAVGRITSGGQQMIWKAFAAASASVAFACTLQAATLVPLDGKAAGQAAEEWARWSFSFDRDRDGGDPINDDTGEFQTLYQDYPLYMVGGATREGVERAFTAPAGRPFFVPMINSGCLGNEEFGTCVGDEASRDFIGSTDRLLLSVNGQLLVDAIGLDAVDEAGERFFADSGIFSLELAENNWGGLPSGVYPESYVVGYFAALSLPVGLHELTFGGSAGGFSNSVTARIEVVPLPGALPLMAGGVLMLAWAARRRRREAR
jgi:hypothetical protein